MRAIIVLSVIDKNDCSLDETFSFRSLQMLNAFVYFSGLWLVLNSSAGCRLW